MQQNVVVTEPAQPRQERTGSLVEYRKQGRYTWTVKIIRGGKPVADRKPMLQAVGRKV